MSLLGGVTKKPSSFIIDKLFKKIIEEKREHERKEDTYWVSDLVMCPQKRVYSLSFPELTFNLNINTITGTILHEGLEKMIKDIFGDQALVEEEVEKTVTIDNRTIRITGRPDVIIIDNNEKIPIEIKTVNGYSELPFEHHAEQLKVYLWLLGVRRGYLLYKLPEGFAEFVIEANVTDDDIIKYIKDGKKPRYDWECKYCPFATFCPYRVKTSKK